jgi:hypothetical protein
MARLAERYARLAEQGPLRAVAALVPRALRARVATLRCNVTMLRRVATAPLLPAVAVPHNARQLAEIERRDRQAAESAGFAPGARPKLRSLRIAEVIRQTTDATTLVLENSGSEPFQFTAGQYVTLVLFIDGQRLRRPYSICSDPNTPQYLQVTIKRDPQGVVSQHLHATAKAGELLSVFGPGSEQRSNT